MKLWRRYSLRTILLSISLLFLALPLAGIYFLRIYENALIRQTESELISQAAFVAAIYKQAVQEELIRQESPPGTYGLPLSKPQAIQPMTPHLDLARDKVFAARPSPQQSQTRLDAIADQAGRNILPVLKDAQLITLSGIKVLDYQGLVAAGQEEHGLSFAHVPEFQQAQAGQGVSLLRQRRMPKTTASLSSLSRNSSINVFVGLPIVLNNRLIGTVWLNRTPTNLAQALYGKRKELIWATLALVIAALLITALTSYTITRPIRILVEKTRLIANGDPAGLEPVETPVTKEVAALSESIAAMATTIQHRTAYIQNFTTHVSHEFKTPLTAIQGSVELLQDHLDTMPIEQQRRFLNNIFEDTVRLRHLVTRLLELARADMMEAPAHPAYKVELAPVLTDIMKRHHHETFSIQLTGMPQEAVFVRVSPESLEAVLSNLLQNSQQAQASQLEIAVDVQEAWVRLLVQDNGPGISEGNRQQIFTPFFTTRRTHGGTGLGLSIAQALLERQGGSIQLLLAEQGACFQINLPIA